MNMLTHIQDGDTTLRISCTFGQDKTVTINQFGAVTYLHFRRPNGYGGWKHFSMTQKEYTDLLKISANFEIQVSKKKKSQNINC